MLLIAVSPDTVHIGRAVVPPFITYRERFVSPRQSKIWIAVPQVEVEVTPGKWTSQRDPNNLQSAGEVLVATSNPFVVAP